MFRCSDYFLESQNTATFPILCARTESEFLANPSKQVALSSEFDSRPRLAFSLTNPLFLSCSLSSMTTCSVTPPFPILTVTGKEASLACLRIPRGTCLLIRITSPRFCASACDSSTIAASHNHGARPYSRPRCTAGDQSRVASATDESGCADVGPNAVPLSDSEDISCSRID